MFNCITEGPYKISLTLPLWYSFLQWHNFEALITVSLSECLCECLPDMNKIGFFYVVEFQVLTLTPTITARTPMCESFIDSGFSIICSSNRRKTFVYALRTTSSSQLAEIPRSSMQLWVRACVYFPFGQFTRSKWIKLSTEEFMLSRNLCSINNIMK